ncbi:MAG: YeeE/YedE family protein [Myxococcales bacterium]|nr:YeeE/YedE family protein [Myxococcales bacterium]
MTTGPIHLQDLLGMPLGALVFAAVGFLFGFLLERGGFGDGRNIVAVLYLRDFRVPKVMFSAILTLMAGAYLLGALRVLDLTAIDAPHTWLLPQLVGGLIFGFGFVIGGYCPGTAVVSAVNRKLDGLAYLAGLVVGIAGFAVAYDPLADFYNSTARGAMTFPGWLGVNPGWVLLAAALFAFAFFGFGNRMEAYWARKAAAPAGREAESKAPAEEARS